MNKQEWEQFKTLLQKIGIKPYVMESKNGQGELLGYVVRLNADNVKFHVSMSEPRPLTFTTTTPEPKSFSEAAGLPKRGRPKKV